jgi:16S rRNA (adenine1518-N6/adenine1519-N6)-dimethyltransferase
MELMRRHGIRPTKNLGQNFLISESGLTTVLEAAEVGAHETILEIGAGLGALTCRLARQAESVIAVEIDRRLAGPLKETTGAFSNVRLVFGDILQVDLPTLLGDRPYAVVANIPYNITSHLIRRLLEARRPARRLVLTIQEEVAERITATEGEMSLLALSVQVYGDAQIVGRVPASAFFPAPQVNSAVVRISIHAAPRVPAERVRVFFQLARAGFSQKRKQLKNSLSGGLRLEPYVTEKMLEAAGLEGRVRPQELGWADWLRLADVYAASPGPADVKPDAS